MRGQRWLTLFYLAMATAAAAQEPLGKLPAVQVFCPAVAFDDHDERGRSVPNGPTPVVLMLIGKFEGGQAKGDTTAGPELVAERILFGSPPEGNRVRLVRERLFNARMSEDTGARIYGLVSGGDAGYRTDNYFFHDRTFPLAEEPAMRALARARLDLLVLGSECIFIGKPVPRAPEPNAEKSPSPPTPAPRKRDPFSDEPFDRSAFGRQAPDKPLQQVRVERVLYGDGIKTGALITPARERLPIPLAGDGPFLYFISKSEQDDVRGAKYRLETRWAMSELETVTAALARREKYPVRVHEDEYGRTERDQEILFLGSRAEAMELLGSNSQAAEILGARRLLHDGAQATGEVAAAVERNLFRDKLEAQGAWRLQWNLIRLLGKLEEHRPDGNVARLIDTVLSRAEAGATFPAIPDKEKATGGVRTRAYEDLDLATNHSLAWLVLTLNEQDAARLFCRRLQKLRDLAAYGWKDEAQAALDQGHLEDHLELAGLPEAVAARAWQAGFDGGDVNHCRLAWSADGKWFAAVGHSTGKVWSTADWTLAGSFNQPASVNAIAFTPDGRHLIVAGGGAIGVLDRWDWKAGEIVRRYPGHSDAIHAIQLSADGKRMITSSGYGEKSTLLFDLQNGEALRQSMKEGWDAIRLNPDGNSFLGRHDRSWFRGNWQGKPAVPVPFTALDLVLATDGNAVWTVEPTGKAKPGASPPRKPAIDDPFGDPAGLPLPVEQQYVLRKRRNDAQFTLLEERTLDFVPHRLLLSDDGRTLVVCDERQIQAFAAPDWRATAVRKLAATPREDRQEVNDLQLSPKGNWLALARNYAFPEVYSVKTGERLALGPGHAGEIVHLSFSPDGAEVITAGDDDLRCRWDTGSGKLLAREPVDAALKRTMELQSRRREETFVSEDGKTWTFSGTKRLHRYGSPTAFEIRMDEQEVIPAGANPPAARSPKKRSEEEQEDREGKLLGTVTPRWGQHTPLGVVPGGKYLHVGTHIYARNDLKLVSASNIAGELEQIVFSENGLRYGVLTTDRESRQLMIGVTQRREVARRLRVHDALTGKTLLASEPDHPIRAFALSRDLSKLAAVDDRQEIRVWVLPE